MTDAPAMARPTAKSRLLADSPGLSRARVCQEALALVDDEGLDALSMRRLGARLGVEAMSLYRYVQGKADLLDALHVAVLADLTPVDAGDAGEATGDDAAWRAILGGMARSLRAAMLRHPHVAALFATRPVNAPEAVEKIAYVHDALVAAGFAAADADKAVVEIGIFTVGHALAEAHGRAPTDERSHKTAGPAEFRFGLTALLDGIERHRQSPHSAPPQRSPASPASKQKSTNRSRRKTHG
jgi:TetR/AcrR family tetracycline transcriptional repressor